MTPVIGDIIESSIGKVVDRLVGRFLPEAMSEAEREKAILEARKIGMEEAKLVTADVDSARKLAAKESEGAPAWTKVLTVTHRPLWSFIMLGIFAWTVLAPYLGFAVIPLTEIHRDVMQTVIVFYFGGRSIEKAVSVVKGRIV
ncbi:MAG: hypothetical protein ACE5EI_10510 [Thermodesulfobacteriota bacterium]